MCVYTYIYIYIYINMCIHKYMYVCMYVYIYIYIYIYSRYPSDICLQRIRTVRLSLCRHVRGSKMLNRAWYIYICYIYIYCVCIYIYIYVCIYIYIYIYIYIVRSTQYTSCCDIGTFTLIGCSFLDTILLKVSWNVV